MGKINMIDKEQNLCHPKNTGIFLHSHKLQQQFTKNMKEMKKNMSFVSGHQETDFFLAVSEIQLKERVSPLEKESFL